MTFGSSLARAATSFRMVSTSGIDCKEWISIVWVRGDNPNLPAVDGVAIQPATRGPPTTLTPQPFGKVRRPCTVPWNGRDAAREGKIQGLGRCKAWVSFQVWLEIVTPTVLLPASWLAVAPISADVHGTRWSVRVREAFGL